MPALRNPRHELFAQELSRGTNQTFAYLAAFACQPRAARASASQLLSHPNNGPIIKARVAELQEEAAHEAQRIAAASEAQAIDTVAVTREWIMAQLVRNVVRCMQGEPVLNDRGEPTGDWRHQPGPANKALELLGKEINMFREAVDVTTTVDADLDRMTPDEVRAEAERIGRALGLGKGLAG